MTNDIKRIRERYLDERYSDAGASLADRLEYSFTQAIALGTCAAAVVFVAYIGVASAWAIVASL